MDFLVAKAKASPKATNPQLCPFLGKFSGLGHSGGLVLSIRCCAIYNRENREDGAKRQKWFS